MATELRVIIAEDNVLIRRGLRLLLQMEPGVEVVGEAGDGPTAVRMAAEVAPDVVVMDINLPGLDGIEATRQIMAARGARPRIIALTGHSDKRLMGRMIEAGASGCVLKVSASGELAEAIRTVAAGGVYPSTAVPGAIAPAAASDPGRES
jgi:DNA-binding NarL/FixJ family response regulator